MKYRSRFFTVNVPEFLFEHYNSASQTLMYINIIWNFNEYYWSTCVILNIPCFDKTMSFHIIFRQKQKTKVSPFLDTSHISFKLYLLPLFSICTLISVLNSLKYYLNFYRLIEKVSYLNIGPFHLWM